MKIDDFMAREYFFEILSSTIKNYQAVFSGQTQNVNAIKLYMYPKLNAIIGRNPSKPVRSFLRTEYTVAGSLIRKLLVNSYLRLALHSKGLFSHPHQVSLMVDKISGTEDLLIYPCNKKVRFFNFRTGLVDVIAKAGFPAGQIRQEIAHRQRIISPNVEPLLAYGENWYRERIIDGVPLARTMNAKQEYEQVKAKALEILRKLAEDCRTQTSIGRYANTVQDRIFTYSAQLLTGELKTRRLVSEIAGILYSHLDGSDESITLSFSHGDFHHGNIWIENQTKRIIIIDWETAEIRSAWYDVFTLYGGLRETGGIKRLLSSLQKGIGFGFCYPLCLTLHKQIMFLILLEDLHFRITDLYYMPFNIGIKDFGDYCQELFSNLSDFK